MAHSPTPSTVNTAAEEKGLGKNADAACDSWCSANRMGLPAATSRAMTAGHPEFLCNPQRHRHDVGAQAARGEREVRFEDAVELEQGLVVKGDRIELVGAEASLFQAELNRPLGEGGVVALAGEALLLGGSDDLTVLKKQAAESW